MIYNGGAEYGGDSTGLTISVDVAVKVKTIVLKSINFKWNDGKTQKTSEIEIFVNACVEHNWVDATCSAPKHCTACGLTEGEATDHIQSDTYSTNETHHWYACKFCDIKYEEEAHTPDYDVATEEHGIKCTKCNYVIAEPIAHVHSVQKTNPGVEAGCETAGSLEYYECSCGKLFLDSACTVEINNMSEIVIDAKGHTEVTVPGSGVTCTASGLTDGVKCSVCGTTIKAQETIPAKGHTEVTVPGSDATCSVPGLTNGVKCSVCGETIVAQETIPATGHTVTFKNNGATISTVKVACGDTVTEPTVSPESGYELDGWYFNGTKWSFANGVTEDMVLEVKFLPVSVEYTITYHNENGAANTNKTSYSSTDATFALASLSKDGCVFLGWYIDDDYAQKVTEITNGTTGNLDIYAKWAKYIDEETSGSITVDDKISGNLTGTYDYAIVDGAIVVYKNGEVTSDIAIIANLDGTYSFMSAGLSSPQKLVKVDGEDYICSVNISLGSTSYEAYVVTFTDDRIPDEHDLVLQVNNIVVDNLVGGTNIIFTSSKAANYKLELFVGETNALVYLNGVEITLPYEFSLKANETIVFNVRTKNGEADTINIYFEEHKNTPELPDDEF